MWYYPTWAWTIWNQLIIVILTTILSQTIVCNSLHGKDTSWTDWLSFARIQIAQPVDKWDRATLLSTANGSNATAVKKCGGTFSETKGTAFYRLQTDHDQVSNMISLMKHGCPPQAIVATYGYVLSLAQDQYILYWEAKRHFPWAFVGLGT